MKAANAASFGWQLSGSRSYLAAQVPALIAAPVPAGGIRRHRSSPGRCPKVAADGSRRSRTRRAIAVSSSSCVAESGSMSSSRTARMWSAATEATLSWPESVRVTLVGPPDASPAARPSHIAALLEARHGVRQSGQRGRGDGREVTHPERVVGFHRQHGQDHVLEETRGRRHAGRASSAAGSRVMSTAISSQAAVSRWSSPTIPSWWF